MTVRRESVHLSAQDDLTPTLLKVAAAAELANNRVDSIGGPAFQGRMRGATREVSSQSRAMEDYESRARRAERGASALADTAIVLGPAFGGAAALAIPALAGLTAQLGFAVAGAGSAILAFHGMGDALKALDAYQLDPSAANLEKLNLAMDKLGPSGQQFVRELDRLEPKLKQLKVAAEDGLLPGVEDGLGHLLELLPQVRDLVSEVSSTTGDLVSDAGRSLASGDFDQFFAYLQTNARPILSDLGATLGHITAGMANLLVDFAPQEREFGAFLADTARGFDDWAQGLSRTEGFQDFLDFLAKTGPEVGHALGSIANAVVAVSRAGAPLSGPTLHALAELAELVAKIADSPIGTPLVTLAAGIALVNRALATSALAKNSLVAELLLGKPGAAANGIGRGASALERTRTSIRGLAGDLAAVNRNRLEPKTIFAVGSDGTAQRISAVSRETERLRGNLTRLGKGAAAVGGLTVATTGAADSIGLTNTAAGALIGTIGGPWGIAFGAGVGAVMDLSHAVDKQKQTFKDWAANAPTDKLRETSRELERQKAALEGRSAAQNLAATGSGYGAMGASQNELSGKDQRKLEAINRELGFRNAREGAANLAALQRGFSLTARGAELASDRANEFETGLARLNNQLGRFSGVTAYRSALLDVNDALKENGKTLDKSSRQGLANRAVLSEIAAAAQQQAQNLADAGDRLGSIKFLDGAQRQLAQAARAFGLPARAADNLARRLLGLGGIKATPTITADNAAAIQAITAVKAGLRALNGDTATTFIKTVHLGASTAGVVGGTARADGGRVYGPGGPRDDLIPTWLSNGEGVIKAATMDYYDRKFGQSWFDDLNAGRFASGGRIKRRGRPKPAGQPNSSYDELQSASELADLVQQVNDLVRQLSATKVIGKKGHKHRVPELQGAERNAAQAQLNVARDDLAFYRKYGKSRDDAKSEADDAAAEAQQRIDDAEAAAKELSDNRAQVSSQFTDSLDLFSRGTSALSAERAASRFYSDLTNYKAALEGLIAAGAGVGILKNIERVAESGDYRTATKLARNLVNDPVAIGNIDAIYAQTQALSSGIANLVTGSAFGAGNAGVQSNQILFNFLQDPSAAAAEMARLAQHYVGLALTQAA